MRKASWTDSQVVSWLASERSAVALCYVAVVWFTRLGERLTCRCCRGLVGASTAAQPIHSDHSLTADH